VRVKAWRAGGVKKNKKKKMITRKAPMEQDDHAGRRSILPSMGAASCHVRAILEVEEADHREGTASSSTKKTTRNVDQIKHEGEKKRDPRKLKWGGRT